MKVLVINCGSSSVKFQLCEIEGDSKNVLSRGIVERIGEGNSTFKNETKKGKVERECRVDDHNTALRIIMDALLEKRGGVIKDLDEIYAVGHRVVHGGERSVDSVLVTDEVMKTIGEYSKLAPLHNPANLLGIRAAEALLPRVPHVAVFDTAFHQTMPDYAYMYAIDYSYYEKFRIRKYGFHGTSHKFVATRAAKFLGIPFEKVSLVTCHLGNGCSITAVKDGKSVDTSMGFTPLEGVPMGTRSGDIDPAIIGFICDRENLTASEVTKMLNEKSGLVGVSGISNDLRTLCEKMDSGHKRAALAIRMFCYRVRKYIGAYLAVNGHTDAVVFTGGIGENAVVVREMICRELDELGILLDREKNSRVENIRREVSADGSRVRVLVIPTDEQWLIADDSLRIAREVKRKKA